MDVPTPRPSRASLNARARRLAEENGLPTMITEKGRVLATRPEAVFVFLFRPDESLLLLRRPGQQSWQTVAGAVDGGESILEAGERELREELGSEVRATFLGLAHAWTYRFDDRVQSMTDLAWVASYEGGELLPGDDMAGSELRWFAADESPALGIAIPEGSAWLIRRALTAYRAYRGERSTHPDQEQWPEERS